MSTSFANDEQSASPETSPAFQLACPIRHAALRLTRQECVCSACAKSFPSPTERRT